MLAKNATSHDKYNHVHVDVPVGQVTLVSLAQWASTGKLRLAQKQNLRASCL